MNNIVAIALDELEEIDYGVHVVISEDTPSEYTFGDETVPAVFYASEEVTGGAPMLMVNEIYRDKFKALIQ